MEVLDEIVILKCRVEVEPGINFNTFLVADHLDDVVAELGGRCMNPQSLELGKPRCYYLPPGAVAFEPGTFKSSVTFYGPDLSAVSAMKERVQKVFDYRLRDTEIAGDMSHG